MPKQADSVTPEWRFPDESWGFPERAERVLQEQGLNDDAAKDATEPLKAAVSCMPRKTVAEWLNLPSVTLDQALCLSYGLEPMAGERLFLVVPPRLGFLPTLALRKLPPQDQAELQKRLEFAVAAIRKEHLEVTDDGCNVFVSPGDFMRCLRAGDFSIWKPVRVLLADAKHEPQAADVQGADDDIERMEGAEEGESWPDPTEYTMAKVWHTKDDALHFSTKTKKKSDGQVTLRLHHGEPTKQMKILRLLAVKWPEPASIKELLETAYPHPEANDIRNLCDVVYELRKKLEGAGCNPDILPKLRHKNVDPNTTLSLRAKKVYPGGELRNLWDWKTKAMPYDKVRAPEEDDES